MGEYTSINCAGIGNISTAATPDLELDVFTKILDINIKGTLLCVRAVTKVMARQEPLSYTNRQGTRSLGRGSIVNLRSLSSYVAAPGTMSYTTSKHALTGLTKSAAIDTFKSHIRVNSVCPAYVDTPMMQVAFERKPELAKLYKAVSPLHRVAAVDEVADYIVFLCSPSASYINGTGLTIDAGISLTIHAS